MKRQRNEKPIDEELLMWIMAGEAIGTGEPGTGKEETTMPVEKAQGGEAADTRWRRGRQTDYETTFLKGMDIPARYGKPVYVRREYHERIAKISVILTGGKASFSAYIDNVLAQHFEQYREEIGAAYAEKLKNLFQIGRKKRHDTEIITHRPATLLSRHAVEILPAGHRQDIRDSGNGRRHGRNGEETGATG